MRDAITLTVHYDTPLDMTGSTVIGLSQSGRTPDVVEYVARARAAGALTIAVTNEAGLELGTTAEVAIPLARRARARSRRNEDLRQHARRARARSPDISRAGATRSRPGSGGRASSSRRFFPRSSESAAGMALPFAYTGRMFVIGRGVEFATAREIALKLLETCRIAAEPLTATDLAHGPVAALDPLFPVWAIASPDATLAPVQEAAARARAMGATLVASGTAASELDGAAYVLPVPSPAPQLLSPSSPSSPGSCSPGRSPRARPRSGRAARPRQGHAGALISPAGASSCRWRRCASAPGAAPSSSRSTMRSRS